jgi:hypothetical protein
MSCLLTYYPLVICAATCKLKVHKGFGDYAAGETELDGLLWPNRCRWGAIFW